MYISILQWISTIDVAETQIFTKYHKKILYFCLCKNICSEFLKQNINQKNDIFFLEQVADDSTSVSEVSSEVWTIPNNEVQTQDNQGQPPTEVHVVVSVQPEEKKPQWTAYQERRSGRIPTRKRSVPFKFRYKNISFRPGLDINCLFQVYRYTCIFNMHEK